jgi:WD40 repeat protein
MPEARLKREEAEPENREVSSSNRLISALLKGRLDLICSAMSASGALVAVRDTEGVRCLVSTGDAPAVGSRLQPDSAFTRACLETGEVVLCENAENDSRIHPSVAKALHLRSAVAVPIQAQGSVVAIIEVFSSQNPTICSADVATLKEIASLFAFFLARGSSPNGPIVGGGSAPLSAQAASPSSAEEQRQAQQSVSANWFPTKPRVPLKRPVDSPLPRVQPGSGPSPSLPQRPAAKSTTTRGWSTDAVPTVVQHSAGKSTSAQLRRGRVASVSFLAVLFFFLFFFFFFGTSRPMSITTSPNSRVPPAAAWDKHGAAKHGPTEAQTQSTGRTQDPKGSKPSSPASISSSTPSPPSSRAEPAEPSPVEQDNAIASNVAPEPAVSVGEAARLKPFELPPESAKSATLALTAAAPSPIRPGTISGPDFVLDHTLKGHSGWVTGVAFSSDGRRLASGSWDQTVKLWDVPTGKELNVVGSKMKEVQALAFSRDGHWLAVENSSNTVTLWDATTETEIHTLPSNKPLGPLGKNWVYSIAFSPDGRWLASGVDDKTVRIWDVRSGRAVRDLTGLRRSVIYAAFSPDGRWLASGDDDKSIGIWEVSSGKEIRRLTGGHKKPIYAVAFSPNGRWLASASADKTIKLWDIEAGREVQTLTGHGDQVTSVSFSPDGRWLASGSRDKTIKIWDVETGQELQTLGAHDHPIYTVTFDSTGHWLASGSEDGTIKLWRLSDAVDRTKLR